MLGFLHLILRLCFSRVGWCSIRILAVLTALRPGSYSQFENALNMEQQHLQRCEWKAVNTSFPIFGCEGTLQIMWVYVTSFLLSCVSVSSAKPFTWYILDWWRCNYEFLFIYFYKCLSPVCTVTKQLCRIFFHTEPQKSLDWIKQPLLLTDNLELVFVLGWDGSTKPRGGQQIFDVLQLAGEWSKPTKASFADIWNWIWIFNKNTWK